MSDNNTVNFKEQKKILQKKQRSLKHVAYKSKIVIVFQTIILLAVVAALCHYCTTN